jgi:hypothetical protein
MYFEKYVELFEDVRTLKCTLEFDSENFEAFSMFRMEFSEKHNYFQIINIILTFVNLNGYLQLNEKDFCVLCMQEFSYRNFDFSGKNAQMHNAHIPS